jgi:putative ABC transport system permease protein
MAGNAVSSFRQDMRYGTRLLKTNPGFAAVAILSLALGIGANTAIFQLLDAVRMRTLPVKDPQNLAFVQITNRTWSTGSFSGWYSWVSNPIWEQIRDRQQGFSSIFAFGGERLNLAKGGEARYANTVFVSGDAFKTLVHPAPSSATASGNASSAATPPPSAGPSPLKAIHSMSSV